MQSCTCIDHSMIWLYLIHSTPHALNFLINYWHSHSPGNTQFTSIPSSRPKCISKATMAPNLLTAMPCYLCNGLQHSKISNSQTEKDAIFQSSWPCFALYCFTKRNLCRMNLCEGGSAVLLQNWFGPCWVASHSHVESSCRWDVESWLHWYRIR